VLAKVGYAGGYTANPTEEEVSTGRTYHLEVVRVVFNPDKNPYIDLLKVNADHHTFCHFFYISIIVFIITVIIIIIIIIIAACIVIIIIIIIINIIISFVLIISIIVSLAWSLS
jgi:hypothetical protein